MTRCGSTVGPGWSREAPFFDEMVVKGHRPVLAVVVDIDELFRHCAKAFLRSGLWDPETWDPKGPSRRAVIAHTTEQTGMTLEIDEYYGSSTRRALRPRR